MERIFIQSVLFGTAILVVYAFVSPPIKLSAQISPTLDPDTRVRKGVIEQVDANTGMLVIDFQGVSVPIVTNASTTVNSPNGEEAGLEFLRDGSAVYIFGDYDKENHSILAEKIVIRNKSPLERKTLSRAEMKNMRTRTDTGTSSILDSLSLTAK
jgi:hypothetical protein